jgi:lipid-binding SYLF domain-containing protein
MMPVPGPTTRRTGAAYGQFWTAGAQFWAFNVEYGLVRRLEMWKQKDVIIMSALALALVVPAENAPKEKEAVSTSESRDPGKEAERVIASANILKELMNTPESNIPSELLDRAHAIAVVPNVVKAAFGVGGQHGKGLVTRRLSDRRWGAPAFIDLSGGSFGLQIGVSATDLVLVFTNEDGLKGLFEDKVELGGSSGVAAGPVGRSAEAGTNVTFDSPIYSYSRSKGLFAGISLKGTVMTIDDSANHHVYGNKVSGREILLSGKVAPAPVFSPFLRALKQETQVAKATIESSGENEKTQTLEKTSVNEPVIKSTGVTTDAKSAQEALKAKGFYDGEVDGVVGPKTRRAISEYQKSERLEVTGRLDSLTAEKLGLRR